MSRHTMKLHWQRAGQDFLGRRYSRRHLLQFDGGLEVPASSSPHVVPEPMSDARAMDPEEAFVASLSSCHMLWFLDIAARCKYCVDDYFDEPEGVMGPNAEGRLAMTLVELRPTVRFAGELQPTRQEVERMHHEAHQACFIANSVKTAVRCTPVVLPINA